MGNVIPIGLNDRRIDALLVEKFSSPAFVSYLRDTLKAYRGTYGLVNVMSKMLAPYVGSRKISRSDVGRLGVHDDNEATARVFEAVKKQVPDIVRKLVILGLLIKAVYLYDPQREKDRKAGLEPDPKAEEADNEDMRFFSHVFQCAVAMLIGVEIDPQPCHTADEPLYEQTGS